MENNIEKIYYFKSVEIEDLFSFLEKENYVWHYPQSSIRSIIELKKYIFSLNLHGAKIYIIDKKVVDWDLLEMFDNNIICEKSLHWFELKKEIRLKKLNRLINA